jgi:ribosomal protein S18 acetylase RimI-like enzyme
MLDHPLGLDQSTLDAIAGLESRALSVDGGRLKLEWATLRSRPSVERNDVLWWEDGVLIGYVGRYAFGGLTPEATGVVDPLRRRNGIGSALLDALLSLCSDRGDVRILLVAPRSSSAARTLATRRGGTFHHAEHALTLTTLRGRGSIDPAIRLRKANAQDAAVVQALLESGFGHTVFPTNLDDPADSTFVAERAGRAIATLRLSADANGACGIYGFVVDPELQGRGIGRDLLRLVCGEALEGGAPYVHLEVEVDNDRALGLYTSVGFEMETTEDYYELTAASAARTTRLL